MNLQVNLRPDANQTLTITVPLLDAQGKQVYSNGAALTREVVNPLYVPNRGKSTITVYAKNHNVLRIVNGFAGLLFKI
jgi:hypothetical protein